MSMYNPCFFKYPRDNLGKIWVMMYLNIVSFFFFFKEIASFMVEKTCLLIFHNCAIFGIKNKLMYKVEIHIDTNC